MAAGRGGFPPCATAAARAAGRVELSRVFVGRPGSDGTLRRRAADARARGGASAELGRDHRRPGLGAVPDRLLLRRGRDPRARGGDRAGRPRPPQPSRRRLLAGRTRERGAVPVAPRVAAKAGAGREGRNRAQAGAGSADPSGAAGQLSPAPESVVETAPAKLNLYLHVVGRRADGYHLLDSLIAFAECGDVLRAAPAATLSLSVDGPFAAALAGESDNLVLRAARRLAEKNGEAGGAGRSLC